MRPIGGIGVEETCEIIGAHFVFAGFVVDHAIDGVPVYCHAVEAVDGEGEVESLAASQWQAALEAFFALNVVDVAVFLN